jgi:hypothetical protein
MIRRNDVRVINSFQELVLRCAVRIITIIVRMHLRVMINHRKAIPSEIHCEIYMLKIFAR